jgi:hypothetical protein
MEREDAESRFRRALAEVQAYPSLVKAGADYIRDRLREGSVPGNDDDDDIIETTENDDGKKEAEALPPPPHINLFQHPDTHPAILDILLLRKYGPEWMLWEPETLALRIPLDFHTGEVSDLNMHKIQAMKTLHVVDSPWTAWEVFVWCAMPLNGLFPDFEVMQVPTVAQVLVAIDVFNIVRQDVTWSDELATYLGTVWRHEGLFVPVSPADFITIDTSGTKLDLDKIRSMWPEVRQSRKAPSDENAESEQLRRMLEADTYLRESQELFERQMKGVLGA